MSLEGLNRKNNDYGNSALYNKLKSWVFKIESMDNVGCLASPRWVSLVQRASLNRCHWLKNKHLYLLCLHFWAILLSSQLIGLWFDGPFVFSYNLQVKGWNWPRWADVFGAQFRYLTSEMREKFLNFWIKKKFTIGIKQKSCAINQHQFDWRHFPTGVCGRWTSKIQFPVFIYQQTSNVFYGHKRWYSTTVTFYVNVWQS